MNVSGRATRIAAVLALVATALLGSPGVAGAASAQQIHIVATEQFGEPSGSFEASGGGLCSSGTTTVVGDVVTTERRNMLTFELDKVFTCADGSGSFTVHMRAHWSPCEPADKGTWHIVSGTGSYEGMSGHGQLVGTYTPAACAETGIVDVLDGVVQNR